MCPIASSSHTTKGYSGLAPSSSGDTKSPVQAHAEPEIDNFSSLGGSDVQCSCTSGKRQTGNVGTLEVYKQRKRYPRKDHLTPLSCSEEEERG